jgi:copper chaperone
VSSAEIDFPSGTVRISFSPSCPSSPSAPAPAGGPAAPAGGEVDMLALALAIENAGYRAAWGQGDAERSLCVLRVEGMTCAHCTAAVRRAVQSQLPGSSPKDVQVSLEKNEVYLLVGPGTDIREVVGAVEDAGYLACVVHVNREVALTIVNWVSRRPATSLYPSLLFENNTS